MRRTTHTGTGVLGILSACLATAVPAALDAQTRMASADAVIQPVSARSLSIPRGVEAVITVNHLLLVGGSYREVHERLRVVGPRAAGGELANGVTDYDLVPRLTPVSDGTRCRPRGVRVDVTVQILLPEWVDHEQAPFRERRRWTAFLDRLTRHENAHRDVTLRAAEALDGALRSLEASSCGRLIRRIDGTIRAAQDELDRAHAALDAADRMLSPR